MKPHDLLWPCCRGPEDLAAIESIPLSQRGLPVSTNALLHRAAKMWPDRPAVTVIPDTTQVSDQQLRDWAATHVTEPAAAPKAVTIVDALPVTAIGKPHKLPLRADATRVALRHALTGIGGVRAVEAGVEDGTVTAMVTIDADADATAVQTILDCYAVTAQIRRPS